MRCDYERALSGEVLVLSSRRETEKERKTEIDRDCLG